MAAPGEKREPRGFEPPPWERERFEELARKRAEEAPEQEVATKLTEEPVPELSEVLPQVEVAEEPSDTADQAAPLDETKVAVMMDLLRQEEPAQEGLWKAGLLAAGLIIIIGCLLVFWGIAAMVAARGAGVSAAAGATVLLVFGAGFVFGGMWVAGKNLRDRGVL